MAQAAQSKAPLRTAIAVPKMLSHPFARKLWAQLERDGVPCLPVSPEQFLRLSRAQEPQWIGAVAAQRWERLDQITPGPELCWLALDTLHSPGNLGTLLRTCDAVGAAGLMLIGPAIDPYDPATVRSTMGALFSQHFVRANLPDLLAWKRKHHGLLVGTSPHAGLDYQAAAYPSAAERRPLILWLGGERQGLTGEQQAACDCTVRIPMVGRSDSLNLAVAASVLLYEVFNQRRRTPPRPSATHSPSEWRGASNYCTVHLLRFPQNWG